MNGELCHHMGSLLPDEGQAPSYAQLYIYDPEAALDARRRRNRNLDPTVLMDLQTMILAVNPYATLYKHAYEII